VDVNNIKSRFIDFVPSRTSYNTETDGFTLYLNRVGYHMKAGEFLIELASSKISIKLQPDELKYSQLISIQVAWIPPHSP